MNIAKTKVMVVEVYLGQHYSLNEKNQNKEIQRRIMAGWAAYAKHRDIFKSYDICCGDLDTDQTSGSPNKHVTNLRPHRPKWKEVC